MLAGEGVQDLPGERLAERDAGERPKTAESGRKYVLVDMYMCMYEKKRHALSPPAIP